MKVHLFFEQSGTFKNEFKKLGYEAEDYDIFNDFGETDNQIDLFSEIEKAYGGTDSIFDKISPDDLIMAFFPCVRFSKQMILQYKGISGSLRFRSDKDKLLYDLKFHQELNKMYTLITELAIVCLDKGIKLIIENPYSEQHYLTRYWALTPAIIDIDRTKRGDKFIKPTQYWFIGFKPKCNIVTEPIDYVKQKRVLDYNKVERSMITPCYARRFIKEFIL